MIGYQFIKKNTTDGVLMEIWQDDPEEKDPKKHWKKDSPKDHKP